MTEAPQLVTNLEFRTDAVKAQELREAAQPILAAVCTLMERARADGLTLNFNINPDAYGRFVSTIQIIKPL